MFKFISAAWGIWKFIAPIYKDLMTAIKRVNETNLENIEARNAVKQEITDLVQNHALKNVSDSKMNAAIEICYQVYLISKKG
jgi:hypothetical protein